MGQIIDGIVLKLAFKTDVLNVQFLGQGLKLTVLASDTGQALLLMRGQDELQGDLSGFTDLGAVGDNLQALGNGVHTGGLEASGADVYNTHTACADFIDILEEAKGGNIDAGTPGCLKNCGPLGGLHFFSVYC